MDQNHTDISTAPEQGTTSLQPPIEAQRKIHAQDTFAKIQRVTAWTMILSAILFALIGILAVWQVLGPNTGDIIWRSFSSEAIIAFAALIINVAARTIEHKK